MNLLENARGSAEEYVMIKRKTSSGSVKTGTRLNGVVAFLGQVVANYRHTGAVMPSSGLLARAMTRSLREHTGSKRLLEVGPGTGAFTSFILKSLKRGDELHLVEINPAFARHLEKKLLGPFRKAHPGIVVKLYCEPIESAAIEGTFDYIVCGLPFNNFPPVVVRAIFRRLLELLNRGGELAYFEYAGVRVMKGSIVDKEGRRKLKQIHMVNRVLSRRHQGERELVLGNVPPAVAVRLTR